MYKIVSLHWNMIIYFLVIIVQAVALVAVNKLKSRSYSI